MKVSELWLREWIELPINTLNLTNQLTMIGLEVECIKSTTKYFKNIFIANIVKSCIHPKINSLKILTIDIGNNRLYKIITKSTIYDVNQKIVVAIAGSVLANNITINNINIHGEISEGIICKFTDLGISEYSDNIIYLPNNALIGMDIKKYLKLDDNILEINVTPNRADCLSILGIARDIAAYNKKSFNKTIHNSYYKPLIKNDFSIYIKNNNEYLNCIGKIIFKTNLNINTPIWIKEKLRKSGIKSINIITDIKNYVLYELGQPIYIFDFDKINGNIIIKKTKKEKSCLINNSKNILLKKNTILITDYEKILSIVGISKIINANIDYKTNNILLLSLSFLPSAVYGVARCYNIHDNFSHISERGIDPGLQIYAIKKITKLLLNICGGESSDIIISKDNVVNNLTSILLRREKLNKVIGFFISDKKIINILSRLGFNIKKNIIGWDVTTPSWRFDIKLEEDVIGEIIRIYGYDKIKDTPIYSQYKIPFFEKTQISLSDVKLLLTSKGYQEVITYSFVDPKKQKLLHPSCENISIQKPISTDKSVMRLSLWTGLIETAIYNQNRQQKRIRIFESGYRFLSDKTKDFNINQEFVLSGIATGDLYEENWGVTKRLVDYYDVKGDVESILDFTGKLNNIYFIQCKNSVFHPEMNTAIYYNEEIIGYIGVLNTKIAIKLNIKHPIIMFEILWDKINKYKIAQSDLISKFPLNRRDISVILSENIFFTDILKEFKKIKEKNLIDIRLFDIYKGKGIKDGYKSISISLIIQDTMKTLEENEINTIVFKYINILKKKFKAYLRNEVDVTK